MQVRFTYKDGVHDGELNIFDGTKFDSKDIKLIHFDTVDFDTH